ncbi:MAG TPA: endonuclease/exonuclease/phosphatase family protein [Pirellulales bacterium]|nr:endonuclease/exonuclease/phosphatase family protein [Pirellulales bacterium]
MRKNRRLLALLLSIAAGWLGYSRLPEGVRQRINFGGGDPIQIEQAAALPLPPVERAGDSIRIASFNIQVFGEHKLDKPDVAEALAQIIRLFDVVAIQEIRAKSQDIMPRFLALINAEGAHYDYVIGPRLGRTSSKEQYAFVYNAASIECDRESVYTVNDPDDLLHREPLVAGFRVRGPPPSEAFTFTLIDIHTDPDETKQELSVLDDVIRAVGRDGRGEDDVILLGDLNADDRHFGELGQMPYLTWAISGRATNTRGDKLYDNILFDTRATTEYLGRSGAVDLMREFKLNQKQALAISDHLPIWAEFGLREGGRAGRVAVRSVERR